MATEKNHRHYWNHIDPELQLELENMHITEPLFIGQGWTHGVGSDRYGGYIVDRKQIGKKIVWGLIDARYVMGPDGWTAGIELCSLPDNETDPAKCKPNAWIVQSGVYKGTTCPKMYFCDKNGKKFNGQHCTYSWNGASAYSDPSF